MQHRIYEAPDVAYFFNLFFTRNGESKLRTELLFFLISQNKQISETCLSAGILYSMWLCLAYLYILEIINFLGSGTIFKEILITGIAMGSTPNLRAGAGREICANSSWGGWGSVVW